MSVKVTREQFEKFLAAYGREKLTGDTTAICEPPMTRYHDFSGGKMWPDGRVAWIVRNSIMPDDYGAGPDEYNVEDEFASLVS